MEIYGSKELNENVIRDNLCIGCGACIDLCPYFKSYKGKTANLFACSLSAGRCFAYCPKVEVDLDELSTCLFQKAYDGSPLGFYRALKTSKAGPKIVSKKFQSGGTISALMAFALEKGYIDAGVLTDKKGILPVPMLVTAPEEVLNFSGSKYSAAPTLEALNRAVKSGYSKIGVVGTPCQVLAVAQMRSNPMNDSNFKDPIGLVLGLFCTWALDYRLFEPYLKERIDISKINKIDIPPPPADVMVIYTEKEAIERPLEEIREIVHSSCSYCPDMTSEFSDISVGVLENQPEFNTLIIRSERGEKIVNAAVEEGYLELDALAPESRSHLEWAAGNKKQKAIIKMAQEQRLNTTETERCSIMRVSDDVIKRITVNSEDKQ